MDSTWIKLHRKLRDWEWYHDSKMVHLFVHILLSANHKDGKWKGIDVKTGQFITGLLSLNDSTGISIQSLRTCLKRMEDSNEILVKSTNKYSMITVCNYNKYNPEKKATNKQSTNEQQTTNNQSTTNKNVNNEKKEISIRVINKINEIGNKNFKIIDTNINFIIPRLKEGFTEEDCMTVINNKWLDPNFDKQYFKPETLFRPSNFDGYLNEDPSQYKKWGESKPNQENQGSPKFNEDMLK